MNRIANPHSIDKGQPIGYHRYLTHAFIEPPSAETTEGGSPMIPVAACVHLVLFCEPTSYHHIVIVENMFPVVTERYRALIAHETLAPVQFFRRRVRFQKVHYLGPLPMSPSFVLSSCLRLFLS